MSKGTAASVAIVGSGAAGSAMAYVLARSGHRVTVLERGPEYPFPHAEQFESVVENNYIPAPIPTPDLHAATQEGNYKHSINAERRMHVGGTATAWAAWTLRMPPADFRTKSLFGIGSDWPIGYDDLEPHYCEAEELLGVSGTDEDNPFAPRRSKPYPLPPFELGHYDQTLAKRLAEAGIIVHTTPQARTRKAFDGRPACVNYGTCTQCPIGARYSPNHHLALAVRTGSCTILKNASARRIAVDNSGRARAVVYREAGASSDIELAADVIVVAGGAIESARLLLLSARDQRGPGLGVESEHVGRNFHFNHTWRGELVFDRSLAYLRLGSIARGQSHQFVNPPTRGKHGGVKIELQGIYRKDRLSVVRPRSGGQLRLDTTKFVRGKDVLEAMSMLPFTWPIGLCGESTGSEQKTISLSRAVDRFGDPVAHIRYEMDTFDAETYAFAKGLFERLVAGSRAKDAWFEGVHDCDSGHHHHGSCQMSLKPKDGAVDPFCRVHGSPNLFVVGGSAFPAAGTMNPTLTIVALALRTAAFIKSHYS